MILLAKSMIEFEEEINTLVQYYEEVVKGGVR